MRHRMPEPVRFILRHGAIGFLVSAVFVAGFVLSDPGGAGTLLWTAEGGTGVALLWLLCGLTFGGVQIGVATMLLGHQDAPRPRGGSGAPVALYVPVRVRARRR